MFTVGRTILRSKIPLFSPRFASTLAFLESSNGKLTSASLSTLNAASKISQPITAVLFGEKAPELANKEIPNYSENISEVIVASDSRYNQFIPELCAPMLCSIIQNNDISHLFVPSSFAGKSVLPRVASKLDVQPISDIISIKDPQTFERFIYAGNAIETVKTSDKIVLVSVRASSFEPDVAAGGEKPVKTADFIEVANYAKWVGQEIVESKRPELTSAKVVVSGGRGLGSKENFDALMEPLAESLGAAIGASRAAVDAGYVDNSLQVGQTGKIVAPDLYVAVGISGAIQHLAGMKDSKTIVAVNKADDALIFNVADFGLVGDLNEVVPELVEKINARK